MCVLRSHRIKRGNTLHTVHVKCTGGTYKKGLHKGASPIEAARNLAVTMDAQLVAT